MAASEMALLAALVDKDSRLEFGECDANSERAAQIGDADCHYVVLYNPLTNDDNTPNSVEFTYGDGGRQRITMIPGNYSPVLPYKNLRECYVKSALDTLGNPTTLRVSFFYVTRKQER